MASTYTANQGIEKMDTGDQSGTWGATVNTNMDIIDRAISGVVSITLTGSTTTLTTTDGTLTDGMYRVLVLGDGGDLGSDNTITISPNDQDKAYLVYNNLSADRNAIFTQGTGANATVENGETAWIYADGGGSGAIVRTAVSSTKLLDQDGDTGIRVEEGGDDDDTIRFDIAGAEDFTISANSLNVLTGSVLALPDAAVGTPSLTNTGDLNTGLYFPAADTVGVTTGGTEQFRFGSNPIPGGSKNLVTNGGMTVAQRGSTAITASAYGAVDQWPIHLAASAGRLTVTQDSTLGAAAPLGHGYSIKMDCTTAESSVAAADVICLRHHIEAQNLQLLEWGAASAKTVTLSFWMSSPKSGTHCVTLNQPDSSSRHYISEFTVASADTWEQFKVTVPGDSSGTINNDTGAGLDINFPLVCGSTFQNTKDTWAAGEDYGTSSVQNLLDNTANNVFVTGVQLEVGSVATDFAHEDISTTLRKCQRYYQSTTGAGTTFIGVCRSTSGGLTGGWNFSEMRAAPTVAIGTVNCVDGSTGGVDGNAAGSSINANGASVAISGASGLADGQGLYTELKAGESATLTAEL